MGSISTELRRSNYKPGHTIDTMTKYPLASYSMVTLEAFLSADRLKVYIRQSHVQKKFNFPFANNQIEDLEFHTYRSFPLTCVCIRIPITTWTSI